MMGRIGIKVTIDEHDQVSLLPYEVRALRCLLEKFIDLGLTDNKYEVIKRICNLDDSEAILLYDKLTKYRLDSYTGDNVKLHRGQKVWTLSDDPVEATVLDIANGIIYYTETIDGYQGSKASHVFSTLEAAKAMHNSIHLSCTLNGETTK